uniref:Uncharacterized protein MANES_14G006400 n=1 Tax=Rhizophora mucronata TaxID=61149 RepID=A0A2P2JFK8_RHIMU
MVRAHNVANVLLTFMQCVLQGLGIAWSCTAWRKMESRQQKWSRIVHITGLQIQIQFWSYRLLEGCFLPKALFKKRKGLVQDLFQLTEQNLKSCRW